MTVVAAPIYQVLPESFGLHILEGVPCFLVYYLSLQEWLSRPILQPLNFTERKPRLRKVEIHLPMTTQNAGEPRLLALGASVCGWPVRTWAQLPPARVECWRCHTRLCALTRVSDEVSLLPFSVG